MVLKGWFGGGGGMDDEPKFGYPEGDGRVCGSYLTWVSDIRDAMEG
jgi:hypothetical protein